MAGGFIQMPPPGRFPGFAFEAGRWVKNWYSLTQNIRHTDQGFILSLPLAALAPHFTSEISPILQQIRTGNITDNVFRTLTRLSREVIYPDGLSAIDM